MIIWKLYFIIFFTKCKILDHFTFIFLEVWIKISTYEISIVPEYS